MSDDFYERDWKIDDDGVLHVPVKIVDNTIHVPSFTVPWADEDDDDVLSAEFLDDGN